MQPENGKLSFSSRYVARTADLGLKDADVSRLSGIPTSTVSRYRNGGSPRSEHVFPLADALKVSARWLLAGVDDSRVLRDASDSDYVTLPEYDLRAITDDGKGEPVGNLTMRRDWLYLTLHESSGLWITKMLTADRAQALPAGAPIVCKDIPKGEAPLEGQHYLFRVNGGVLFARFSYRSGGILSAGDRVGEVVVTPADLQGDDQHFIIAAVLGALARPFV